MMEITLERLVDYPSVHTLGTLYFRSTPHQYSAMKIKWLIDNVPEVKKACDDER